MLTILLRQGHRHGTKWNIRNDPFSALPFSALAGESTADGVGHLEEFEDLQVYDQDSLADLLRDILDSPTTETKQLSGQRTGYLDEETGTIVVVDPNHVDNGSAFRPEYGDPPRNLHDVWDSLD